MQDLIRNKSAVALSIGLSLISTKVLSAETSTDLKQIVVTASGFEQEATLAPASVTIIDQETLSKHGYRDLNDALRTVPGVTVTGGGSGDRGTDVSIRGMGSSYTLLLVDGKRQSGRESRPNGSAGFEADWLPPIEAIDHIEIIRGPGSVLHGSNAFAGVVNIVLKKRKDYSLETKVTVGNYGYEQAEVYGFNSGDDYSLSVGAYSTRSRGDSFPWLDEVEGIKGSGLRQDFEMGHN
ncbi:hypothetical protein LCGC14_3132110, partial [marine sediment metagenome]